MNTRINNIFTSALTIIFITILIHLTSCDTTEPNKPLLELQFEDASSTEAWITLKTNNLQIPTNVFLFVNEKLRETINLISLDTTIYIDSLLPNRTYNINIMSNNFLVTSNKIQITTMDTTSHNFSWQTFEFGGKGGSSVLYDAAIIDENNIWAVGEIYADTTGQAYNAVHWDGNKWEFFKLQFFDFCGNTSTGSYPAKSVLAFSLINIVISSGSQITWFNGHQQIKTECIPASVNKLWGSSSSNLYAVGNGGNIAHWDGSSWQKIESGTDLPINDIWGDYNEETIEWKILAIASNIYQFENKKILSINASEVNELSNTGLPMDLGSIWFSNIYNSYVGGDGLYVKQCNKNYWRRIELPTYFIFSIRGNGINDMIVCGGLGYIGHYNGSTWINYLENGIKEIQGNYYSSSIKGNKFVAVGGVVGGKAVAIIGTR